jgi:DNA-directed RNA polymerase specialized sigma24 family protein
MPSSEQIYNTFKNDIRNYIASRVVRPDDRDEALANANYYIWNRFSKGYDGDMENAKRMCLGITKKAMMDTFRTRTGSRQIDYRNGIKIDKATYKLKSEGCYSEDAMKEETGLSSISIQNARNSRELCSLDSTLSYEQNDDGTYHDIISAKEKPVSKNAELIYHTLSKMKKIYRDVVYFHNVEGYEFEEIAKAIKNTTGKYISAEGVRVRHIRAIRELRERLGVL